MEAAAAAAAAAEEEATGENKEEHKIEAKMGAKERGGLENSRG